MDLTQQTIGKLRQMLDRKEVSAPELTKAYLDRIAAYDKTIQSYITVTAERAMADADAAQKKIDAGNAGVLCGIPMAIKDNICTDGIKTTCASKMLENFIPPYNATVMEKLMAQNVVMLGKASMDEFAMGGSTQTSALQRHAIRLTQNVYRAVLPAVLRRAYLHLWLRLPLALIPAVRFVSRLHFAV